MSHFIAYLNQIVPLTPAVEEAINGITVFKYEKINLHRTSVYLDQRS